MGYDVAVVGAGVMGSATAYEVAKRGRDVLLIDQFAYDDSRKSSSGYSRIFRLYYDDDEFYTGLAEETLPRWRRLEEESGEKLLYQCGALLIGEGEDSKAMAGYRTLQAAGKETSLLHGSELDQQFPGFDIPYGVTDPNAGIIDADKAVETFQEQARRAGAETREHATVVTAASDGVTLADGETIEADAVVVTAGPWTMELLPSLPLNVTKQDLVFVRPEHPEQFTYESFPIYSQRDINYYGIPIYRSPGVKIARHMEGVEVDPDTVERVIEDETVERCRSFFAEYIPALADAEIVETRVCLYTNTPDHDFIIDTVNGVVVGAGFSGHGFKFAPLLGEILADLALTGETEWDIDRFSVDRF